MPTGRKGFFSASQLNTAPQIPKIARCGQCGLSKGCRSPKMPVTGKGSRKIFVLAEAPGKVEDRKNEQLVGEAGELFRDYLRKDGWSLDRDCWKYNAINCRPPKNRTPSDEEVNACRPNIIKAINKYEPNVILLLGGVAVNSVISHLWKEKTDKIGRWAGFTIPHQNLNSWVIPTYHPSYLLRKNDRVLNRIFRKHLRLALRKKSKPWKKVPNYRDNVIPIIRVSKAARIIRHWIKENQGAVAFDYEANCLKPEGEGVEIISCSVSNGNEAIAYPWHGEAIDATEELLISKVPKIASNIKFEERWTRQFFSHGVRKWYWDTMIAAHTLDNRPHITSLKFQSFVLFGQEPYDVHIKPYLKSSSSNRFNRIKELDLKDLLVYNGLDSLLAYKVAMKQIKEFRRREK
jgi:DNA polymerase